MPLACDLRWGYPRRSQSVRIGVRWAAVGHLVVTLGPLLSSLEAGVDLVEAPLPVAYLRLDRSVCLLPSGARLSSALQVAAQKVGILPVINGGVRYFQALEPWLVVGRLPVWDQKPHLDTDGLLRLSLAAALCSTGLWRTG
jgi:hypothetical protein